MLLHFTIARHETFCHIEMKMLSRQEKYRTKYSVLQPDWQDSQQIYIHQLRMLIHTNSYVLDIGCGHSTLLRGVIDKTRHSYGIDPDVRAVEKNTLIKHKTVGEADELPYPDNFFDVVCLAWVVEHLQSPKIVFREIYRVLKPSGKVIFLTPNMWNYVVWINRLIPNSFHDFLTRRLYDRQEHDTFRVVYRMNSPRKIRTTLFKIGFTEESLICNGDPTYTSFNGLSFTVSCLIEHIYERFFSSGKVHLMGVFKK